MNDAILGVLGGMGPYASETFYRLVNQFTEAKRDQDHLRMMLWSDSSIPDRTEGILKGEEEPVYQALLAGMRRLERAGCTAVAMTCNTAHHFAERLQAELSVPMLDMVKLVAEEAEGFCTPQVGLLATDGTIQTGLYQKALAERGLKTMVLPPELQERVMHLIYDELKQGKPGSWETFDPVDNYLRKSDCGCVILGCTELSVFRQNHPMVPFYIDTLETLARAAIEHCGKEIKKGFFV